MKLSEFKAQLQDMEGISFYTPQGKKVPAHFHVTEFGSNTKHFIDCGGTERKEHYATFQLWTSIDLHHRLKAEKLLKIIAIGEQLLQGEDPEVEVEYQMDTIGRFGLEFKDGNFHLCTRQTACLAEEQCGIPVEKVKRALSTLAPSSGACTPGSGCC